MKHFPHVTLALSIALTMALLVACTGEAGRMPEPEIDAGTPTKNDNPQPPSPDGALTTCSASGDPADCDPVAASGCGEGSCYLIKNQGPSCVCPVATAVEGDSCSTTTECGPGLVCAGTAPPGVCRKTCDPADPSCLDGTFCRVITAFPDYGYCDEAQPESGP